MTETRAPAGHDPVGHLAEVDDLELLAGGCTVLAGRSWAANDWAERERTHWMLIPIRDPVEPAPWAHLPFDGPSSAEATIEPAPTPRLAVVSGNGSRPEAATQFERDRQKRSLPTYLRIAK